MKKFGLFLILAVLLGCSLTACGKMASPEPYEGSGYPHSYPRV